MEVNDLMYILENDSFTKRYKPRFVFSDQLPRKILPNR